MKTLKCILPWLIIPGLSQLAYGQQQNGPGSTDTTSLVLGKKSVVTSKYGIAIGNSDTVRGDFATAIGLFLKALGNGSVAIGNQGISQGPNSFTLGLTDSALNSSAMAFGIKSKASGMSSIAIGSFVRATGDNAFALGNSTSAGGRFAVAIGTYLGANGTNSYIIGNGRSSSDPLINNQNNSLYIGFNADKPTFFVGPADPVSGIGKVGIGTTNPVAQFEVNGDIAVGGRKVIGLNGQWFGDTTGMRGPPGQNGSVWLSGAGAPVGNAGARHDIYLNTQTDSIYQKDSLRWNKIAYIRGSNGTPGINGSAWFIGSGVPAANLGTRNDLYLNTITDSIYAKQASWTAVAYLKGAKGDPGIKGDKGDRGDKGDKGDKGDEGSCSCSATAAASAAAALLSMTAAGASAGLAAESAGLAAGSASGAANSAAAARGSATEAATSAENAAASKTAAKNSETNSKTSEDNAKTSEDAAQLSADSARASAEEAKRAASSDLGGDLSGKISNAKVIKLQGSSISAQTPSPGNLLKWINGSWTPAAPDSQRFLPGTGISFKHDSIIAKINEPLWNAARLQGKPLDSVQPVAGQVMSWRNARWTPDSIRLTGGAGIRLHKDSVIARTNEPVWNAGYVQGRALDTITPQQKQVLIWIGRKWRPGNFDSGWVLDSVRTDTSNIYANIKGNVGIGTRHPMTVFHVQGGRSNSPDSAFVVNKNGNVGIGTIQVDEKYKLSVKGEIRATALTIESDWADYVFDRNYRLKPIAEISSYIRQYGHLPDVPSEKEIARDGLNVAASQKIMMEKIEELTLYVIRLNRENEQLRRDFRKLKKRVRTKV